MQKRVLRNKSYKFSSEGHSIYALVTQSFWLIDVDGANKYRFDNPTAPSSFLDSWQKQKDVDGVYTMLMAMPHTDFPN